jgi:hypothetical protein
MSEEQKQEEVTASGAAEQQSNEAELTVQDLNSLKQVIDVASQRGAFRPNEMMTVGQIYTKLETFLSAVSAQQSAQGE